MKTKTVKVFDSYQDNLPRSLAEFQSQIERVANKIPEELRGTATVDLDTRYEEAVLIIQYQKPLTPEELVEHESKERERLQRLVAGAELQLKAAKLQLEQHNP